MSPRTVAFEAIYGKRGESGLPMSSWDFAYSAWAAGVTWAAGTALLTVSEEYLEDPTTSEEDKAYDLAIDHCLAVLHEVLKIPRPQEQTNHIPKGD